MTIREIPPVHHILEQEALNPLIEEKGRRYVKKKIATVLEQIRKELMEGKSHFLSREKIVNHVLHCISQEEKSKEGIQRVINGTGILLHTNMGRAPLPKEALDAITNVASGYSNLEYDVEKGCRGSRYASVEKLLMELTGAEGAMVVNNNAAAVFIVLNTFGMGKEVILSRAEQVEVGGSFRIPDIITRSGAKMVEVGTTNRTYCRDYEEAITEETAILLKVHKSNYRIEGFTAEAKREEISALAREKGLLSMEDLGSGSFIDLRPYGLTYEPTITECLQKGVDLLTFSGDKLLGGPQCGLILGSKERIEALKRNPLTRMIRIDKLSLIALESVLKLYRGNHHDRIPYIQLLSRSMDTLYDMANRVIQGVGKEQDSLAIEVETEDNEVGGGALPGAVKQSVALCISSPSVEPWILLEKLRKTKVPIIGRIKDGKVLISMRTVFEEDIHELIEGMREL